MDGNKHNRLNGLGKCLKDRFRIEYDLKNIKSQQGEVEEESGVVRKIHR